MGREKKQDVGDPSLRPINEVDPQIDTDLLLSDIVPLSVGAQKELFLKIKQYEGEIARQNEELLSREEQLAVERTRYSDLYNAVPVGCLTVNAKGMVIEANQHAACMLGIPHETLINLSIPRLIYEEDKEKYIQLHKQIFTDGDSEFCELRMVGAGRNPFKVQIKAAVTCDAEGEKVCYVIFTDITGRNNVEEERELMARLITQVNAACDLHACMSELTASLQDWSGCEAVGIRLRDGEDYPYYETRGFPLSFVEAENNLCVYEPDGKPQRDSTGNPVLECMCGNVLSGRFDTAQPFFTDRGSFWSNSTSALLANTTIRDRQTRTRNRCNSEGYESVALVPMRTDRHILGLLQFNDHCPGRFTRQQVQHFERIADTLALAISRRQIEDELRRSEEKYRTVAEYTYSMETWQIEDGTYQYVSPSCERVTGYTAAAFLQDQKLMMRIVHPEDRQKLIQHLSNNHFSKVQVNQGLDFRILTPTGEIRWLSHSCSPVYNAEGQWAGRRGSFREITKSKRFEEDRVKRIEKNRQIQKSASLQRMGGAIAHHFNNKLHVVMGYLELAIEHLPIRDVARYNLTSALNAAEQAAEISRLMLIYLGHIKRNHAPVDLAVLCRENLPTLKKRLRQGLKLETDLNVPGPVIDTNTEEILQILLNTVANASEATTDTHGYIHLRVTVSSATEILVKHRFPENWQPTAESYACLEVRDNGCGLSISEIEEIFDPFYSTKFTGRGLGLPVVTGLVKAHGGVVTVESSPGIGSTFRSYFPLSTKRLPLHLAAGKSKPEISRHGTVLVVDDDAIVLEITSTLLEGMGFTVLTAINGLEAVKIFQQHKDKVRLVLSDFAMPYLNGMETLQQLREISDNISVIIVSGYSEEQVMKGDFKEWPTCFIKKPYNLNELKNAIDLTLEESA